jgi:serine/threonine-protein kinase RsbW
VDHDNGDSIRLTVPATSAAVRIARAGAAALATRAGFTYREVEEMRLAVGEAAALLAPETEGDGTLILIYQLDEDTLWVDMHRPGPAPHRPEVSGVASAVLDATVDAWQLDDAGQRLTLRKRATADADEDDEP